MSTPRIIELDDGTALLRCRALHFIEDQDAADDKGISIKDNIVELPITLNLSASELTDWSQWKEDSRYTCITCATGGGHTIDIPYAQFDDLYVTHLSNRPRIALN